MRARVVAPLVAAVLGLVGGVATAVVVPGDGEPEPSSYNDPLHLGIALVDQDCTGDAITVLAYGDGASALGTAVAGAEADGVKARYLRSETSCPTIYGSQSQPSPTWVVYAGPYDKPSEPCATRMEGDALRGSVTVLKSGNEDTVKCACVLPPTAGPELRVGAVADAEYVAWTRLLQVMLNDDAVADGDEEAFPRAAVTGLYDQRTADRVAGYQDRSPGKVTEPGVVDATTWTILTDRMCRNYTW